MKIISAVLPYLLSIAIVQLACKDEHGDDGPGNPGGTNPPPAPTHLVAHTVSSTEITLAWQKDTTVAISGFKVERQIESSGTWELLSRVTRNPQFVDANLSCNTKYSYRVVAYSSQGTSDYSNVASATTAPDSWEFQSSGSIAILYGVAFTDSSYGTAVGSGGIILRTTNGGSNWTQQSSPATENLYGVSFSSRNVGTAVGKGGVILRT
ncbi:MAG: fibronectin type III domain-containing protein, partial [Ignavibacteriales bacterium]|nr:fibronectin type III domain-containing protein [Ignavibacteriales bacterium]